MATPQAIFAFPVANGRVHSTNQPDLTSEAGTNISKWLANFSATASNDLHFAFYTPANYSSAPTIKIRWSCTTNDGNVYLNVSGNSVSTNATFSAPLSTNNTIDTTATTPNTINVLEIPNVTMNIGANKLTFLYIQRAGANVADTCTGVFKILDVSYSYALNTADMKNYAWSPANALSIPLNSIATWGTHSSSLFPHAIILSDNDSAYADVRFTVPPNFSKNLKLNICGVHVENTSAYSLSVSFAVAGLNDNYDTSFSAPVTVASSGTTSTNAFRLSDIVVPTGVTPMAGKDIIVRIKRNSADAATGDYKLFGVIWEYEVGTKNPAVYRLDPQIGSLPNNSATITKIDGNSSTHVTQYAAGIEQSMDYLVRLTSLYSNGGTVKVRWFADTASTNSAKIRVDYAVVSNGANIDPVLTVGTPVMAMNSGQKQINETAFVVSSGLSADKALFVRVSRMVDTLPVSINVIEVTFESNIL